MKPRIINNLAARTQMMTMMISMMMMTRIAIKKEMVHRKRIQKKWNHQILHNLLALWRVKPTNCSRTHLSLTIDFRWRISVQTHFLNLVSTIQCLRKIEPNCFFVPVQNLDSQYSGLMNIDLLQLMILIKIKLTSICSAIVINWFSRLIHAFFISVEILTEIKKFKQNSKNVKT